MYLSLQMNIIYIYIVYNYILPDLITLKIKIKQNTFVENIESNTFYFLF